MSKAEDRALEAFPLKEDGDCRGSYDLNVIKRIIYQQGYEQAEKDNELTLEDIKQICDISFEEACRLQRNMKGSLIYKKQHYTEVLKRFKERKEK